MILYLTAVQFVLTSYFFILKSVLGNLLLILLIKKQKNTSEKLNKLIRKLFRCIIIKFEQLIMKHIFQ